MGKFKPKKRIKVSSLIMLFSSAFLIFVNRLKISLPFDDLFWSNLRNLATVYIYIYIYIYMPLFPNKTKALLTRWTNPGLLLRSLLQLLSSAINIWGFISIYFVIYIYYICVYLYIIHNYIYMRVCVFVLLCFNTSWIVINWI